MKYSEIKKIILPVSVIWLLLAFLIRPEIGEWLWDKITAVTVPVISGLIFAAVADPAVTKIQNFLLRKCRRIKKDAARGIAIAAVYIITALILTAAVWIIMPALIDSAKLFINSLDGYYTDFRKRYEAAGGDEGGLFGKLDKLIGSVSDRMPELFGKTYTATAGFLRSAAHMAVGAVLSVYMLAGKEKFLDFCKGIFGVIMSDSTYKKAAHIIGTVNSCLVNFISGQLAEAAVLGTLCFIGMVIFGFEYPLLISTIIGVTALVPVAGAIVGVIPSALMLFLVKPSSALWFIVFIIILQQLENNFIYPKIVGKSVGLPPILILIVIVSGVQLAGAAGIMLGIPLVSAAYILLKETLENRRDNNA